MSTRQISNKPVQFRALIPKALNVNNMAAPIRDACIKAAEDMGKDLEAVTRTWKGDKPRIQNEAKFAPGGMGPEAMFHNGFTSSAWPRVDGSLGYSKWLWLDEGTKVRYATMTPGFIPKTRAGQLQSWQGKGKMLFVNKKHPRPGIKARKFTKALAEKWGRSTMFRARMAAAVNKAAKQSGHSID